MEDQISQGRTLLNDFLHQLIAWVPKLIGALIILIIGYIIARAVAGLVRRSLRGIRLDSRLHSGHGGNIIQRAIPSPSNLVGSITFWAIFLGSLTIGLGALGIPLVTDLIWGIYAYIPNVIAAVIIFLVASAVAAGAATLVSNVMGDTSTGKIVASGAPVLIMGLAIFMILNQLRIAPAIVTITYAAIIGSVALGFALAFGLGGRDIASQVLSDTYQKAKEHRATVKNDVQRGASRVRQRGRRRRPNLSDDNVA